MNKSELKYKDYEDHFLGEKPLDFVSNENKFYVNSYLSQIRKRSRKNYNNHKSVLRQLLNYIRKDVTQITKGDIKDFFEKELDPRDITLASKENYRSTLRSFFFHVESILEDDNYNNPVPNAKVYKFSTKQKDIRKKSEQHKKLLEKEEIFRILDYTKKNYYSSRRKRYIFFYFSICAFTGARASEVRTIRISDINLEERFLETGFEMDARKSTLKTGESLMFFIPKRFIPYLQNYILQLKADDSKNDWLFPSSESRAGIKPKLPYISADMVYYLYNKIRKALSIKFTMHYFRHSIITHLKRKGLSRENRELLLNHAPSSTEGKHYEHDDLNEVREMYDKYFPYYDFPYF